MSYRNPRGGGSSSGDSYRGRGRGQDEGRRQYEGRGRGQYEGRGRGQYEGRGRGQYEGRGRGQYEGRGRGRFDDERSRGQDDRRGWQGDRRQDVARASTSRQSEGLSVQDKGKFVCSNQSNPPKEVPLVKEGSKLLSRPGNGTAGRPIKLVTNYFKLKVDIKVIYHYDIEMTDLSQNKRFEKQETKAEARKGGKSNTEHKMERKVVKAVRKKVFSKWLDSKPIRNANPVYDGEKNVFTSKPLEIGKESKFHIQLEEEGKTREYEINIKPVNKKDGSNQINIKSLLNSYDSESEIIMALNSILNYREPDHPQAQIGRSFFYLTQANLLELGEGLNIFFGHHQSVQSTQKGPALLINLAAKAFHKSGPVIDYASEILERNITSDRSSLKPWEIDKLRNALKGVKIYVTHLPYQRKFCIENVSDCSAEKLTIQFDDGKSSSVAQYFTQTYSKLQYPFLNCLQMRVGDMKKKQVFIPFEHCVVLQGQPKLGKLEPSQTSSMIRKTAIPPKERFQSIGDSCRDVLRESGKKMSEYDISLDNKFMTVTGRVLARPSIGFNKNKTVVPDNRGVWNINGEHFFQSSIDIKSWILLDFGNSDSRDLDKFWDFFISASKKVGLNFGEFLGIKKYNRNMRVTAREALQSAANAKASFAVIILSRRDKWYTYEEIKYYADFRMNFVSQCFDQKGLRRFNDQMATNLCLKINAKLGGINHVLKNKPAVMKDSTMIMGADAVHFARGSSCPSIAAVVGSVDVHAFKYDVSCRVQDNPDDKKISQELILDMGDMTKSLLQRYHKKQKKHPQNIIFFRDGVSEGQFQTVHDEEIKLVQNACRAVIGRIIPITFLVVQKRHQTRFKPLDPNEGIGKPRNAPPGTVVDTDIVHPILFDYFLDSHEGIQGTSRSAHYTVLHDDLKFSSDELQELCYYMCYTYNKCNRSISIPAPVKYADLACFRAKYIADLFMDRERARLNLKKHESVRFPDEARTNINMMGESGNSFFFL